MCCQLSALSLPAPDSIQWVPGHRHQTQTEAVALPALSPGSPRRDFSAQLHFITAATICQVKSSDFLLWVELATGQALFSLANHAAEMFRQALAVQPADEGSSALGTDAPKLNANRGKNPPRSVSETLEKVIFSKKLHECICRSVLGKQKAKTSTCTGGDSARADLFAGTWVEDGVFEVG